MQCRLTNADVSVVILDASVIWEHGQCECENSVVSVFVGCVENIWSNHLYAKFLNCKARVYDLWRFIVYRSQEDRENLN